MNYRTLVISEREKAVIKYAIAFNVTDKALLYRLAYDGSRADLDKVNNISTGIASRWFSTKKIRDYYDEQLAAWNDRKAKEKAAIVAEALARAEKDASEGLTDFSLPTNQVRKLNELVNTAKDPGEVLDALKVLISRQGDLAPEKKNDSAQQIQRFYTPVTCRRCMIRKAFHKLTTEHPEILKKQ